MDDATTNRRMLAKDGAVLSLRIPPETLDGLKRLAALEDRSMSWVVRRALTAHVEAATLREAA